MSLKTYHKKRDFKRTPEPEGKISKSDRRRFVVQEHHASKLHFDFRLEMGGVLKSWSVPKGPSLDPKQKRLAVPTEDHPIEYLRFEGRIPEGSYGAGEHRIWDSGTYELLDKRDPLDHLAEGKLRFRLKGRKLGGEFTLLQMSKTDEWLLIKAKDEYAETGWEPELILKKKDRGDARTSVRKKSVTPGADKALAASRAFKSKQLGGDISIKVARAIVELTNLDKVYWPGKGYTKGDLIKYYYEISKQIMAYLKGRPLIMKRYPKGIRGSSFHQHDVDEVPDYVRTASLEVTEGHRVDYIVSDNLATLLYVANLGAIERHPWHSRVENLDHPDWFIFDLDPSKDVSYRTICEVALAVRDVLEQLGLECYAKSSGSRGMHVYVPLRAIYSYEEVAEFAERVATIVAKENSEIATVERSLSKRGRGRVYVDHLQNARGKSVVAPYSVRPREDATVSAPLDWKEVERKKVTPQDFTIKNMRARLEKKGDLFEPVLKRKQSLRPAVKELEKRFEK